MSTHIVCSTLSEKKQTREDVKHQKKSTTRGALILKVPVSALPSHRRLGPPALPAAPPVEIASPDLGHTPGRSLA